MDFNACPFCKESPVDNYSYLQSLSLDDFAEWLDKHGQFDDSPWIAWFNETYCLKCESVELSADDVRDKLGIDPFYLGNVAYSYCELNKNCKYFPNMEEPPSTIDIIKLWLKQERKSTDVK